MRKPCGKHMNAAWALALAAALLFPAVQPAGGTSELFKTSAGETEAELQISTAQGYNDSLAFSVPSASTVQSAKFDISALPVRFSANITDSGSSLLNGSTLVNVVLSGDSLKLVEEARSSLFSEWESGGGSNITVQDGSIQLQKDLNALYFTPNRRAVPSNQSEFEPVIECGPDDELYIAWADMREYEFNIYFSRSLDRGATFENVTKINDEPLPRKARQEFPDIASGPGGHIYIVWMDNRSGDEDIFLAASPDSGVSFTAPQRVDDGPALTNQSHPAVAVTASGRVAVVWEDSRSGDDDIRCAFSDNGATFGASVAVNTGTSGRDQDRPRLAAGTQNDFHCVWYDNRSGNFDIYYAHAAGNTFSPDVRVDDSGDTGTFQALPSIAVGPGNRVHVVWHDTRYDSYRIMHSTSTNGLTFSANLQVDAQLGPGRDQYQPRIRAGTDGVVHVVWHDKRNGDPDIYYANSTNNGASFNLSVRVDDVSTDVNSYSPALAVDSLGDIHVVWWDNRTPYGGYGYVYQTMYSRGTHPYYDYGSYETGPIDLGAAPSGLKAFSMVATTAAGTSATALLATASDPAGPWSAFVDAKLAGTPSGPRPARYIRWKAELVTQDPLATPSLSSIILDYAVHPATGTYSSRPVTFPCAVRTASAYWTNGSQGTGPAEVGFQIRNNNVSSWQSAGSGQPVTFTGGGRDITYKLELRGSSSSTPAVSSVSIDVRLESYPSDIKMALGKSSATVWSIPGQAGQSTSETSPELADLFNKALQDARRQGQENALIKVNFTSASPGKIKVGNIRIQYDMPPRILSKNPTGPVTLDENATQLFSVEAEDPDNDGLTTRWLLDGSQVATGSLNYAFTPSFQDSGVHNLTLSISDGILTVGSTWSVTVNNVNRKPVIERFSPETPLKMTTRETVRFETRTRDPDGDLLTYCWTVDGQKVGEQDYMDFTAPLTTKFYTITFSATDGQSTASQSWHFEVCRKVSPPDDGVKVDMALVAGILLLVAATALIARILISRKQPPPPPPEAPRKKGRKARGALKGPRKPRSGPDKTFDSGPRMNI